MWQLNFNAFIYAFAYYLAKAPLEEVTKSNPSVFDPLKEFLLPLGLLGTCILAYLQDKLGSKFSLNLSQLCSTLIYFFGLVFYCRLKDGANAKAHLAPVAEVLAAIPAEAIVAVKLLTMMQHTMHVSYAAVGALRPFASSAKLLNHLCSLTFWYSIGMIGAALLTKNATARFTLDSSELLLIAAGSSFFAWFLNHFTFAKRVGLGRTLGKEIDSKAKKSTAGKPAADPRLNEAAYYDTASFPTLIFRHFFLIVLVVLIRTGRNFFVAETKSLYTIPEVEALAGSGLNGEYVVGTGVMIAIPLLTKVFSPAALTRIALLLAAALLSVVFFPGFTIPAAWNGGVAIAAATLSRVLYMAPTAILLHVCIPGTVAQGLTVAVGFSMTETLVGFDLFQFLVKQFPPHPLIKSEAESKTAIAVGVLLTTFLFSLVVSTKRALLRNSNK